MKAEEARKIANTYLEENKSFFLKQLDLTEEKQIIEITNKILEYSSKGDNCYLCSGFISIKVSDHFTKLGYRVVLKDGGMIIYNSFNW